MLMFCVSIPEGVVQARLNTAQERYHGSFVIGDSGAIMCCFSYTGLWEGAGIPQETVQ
jgi:hypothetical protein